MIKAMSTIGTCLIHKTVFSKTSYTLYFCVGRSISTGNDPLKNGITNNNTVKNATKFTIGTSDESDEDDNAENTQDLEHLFCPLTDSQVIFYVLELKNGKNY